MKMSPKTDRNNKLLYPAVLLLKSGKLFFFTDRRKKT